MCLCSNMSNHIYMSYPAVVALKIGTEQNIGHRTQSQSHVTWSGRSCKRPGPTVKSRVPRVPAGFVLGGWLP